MDEKTYKLFQDKERREFDFDHWKKMLTESQTACFEWNMDAIRGYKLWDNDYPIRGKNPGNLLDYSGEFFSTSAAFQAMNWIRSSQSVADIDIELRGEDTQPRMLSDVFGVNDEPKLPKRGLLEVEMNVRMDEMNPQAVFPDVKLDQLCAGIGWVRVDRNTHLVDNQHLTGRDVVTYRPTACINVDPQTQREDLKDKRFIFDTITNVDVKELIRSYPDKKEAIQNAIRNYRPSMLYPGRNVGDTDTTTVIVCQYKRTIRVKVIPVTFKIIGYPKLFLADDVLSWDKKIETGGDIEIGEMIEMDMERWYEFRYLDSSNVVLDEPTDIGPCCRYVALVGFKQQKSSLPAGLAKYLWQLAEADCIAFTTAIIQNTKIRISRWDIIEDGYVPEDEDMLKKNPNAINFHGRIKGDFLERMKGTGITSPIVPVRFDPMDMSGQIIQQQVNSAIQNVSGATNVAVGNNPLSGQSGALTSALQNAAAVYHQLDFWKLREYYKDIADILKNDIDRYDIYPRSAIGLDEANQVTTYIVNQDIASTYECDNYNILINITASPEAVTQIAQQKATIFKQMGLMSDEDYLEAMGEHNPRPMLERAKNEQERRQQEMLQQAAMQQVSANQTADTGAMQK